MNDSIINALSDLIQKPFKQLNLAFIPTASNLEEGDKRWLIDDLKTCERLGFKSIDIVDISALPKEIWQTRLEDADVLLVEGGNTYHLMYWVEKSGLKDLLPELLKTRVYIGISAGSMIPNPSLVLSSSEKRFVEATGIKMSDQGLGLVDFLIEPHINSKYFPEYTFEKVAESAKNIPHTIYAIDDQSAVKVIDREVSVISEGEWKKFNDH